MKTITLNIPESVEFDNRELVFMLASKLYEEGKLSLGHCAEIAGLSKKAFAEILSKYGVSLFNYPAEELINDVANA